MSTSASVYRGKKPSRYRNEDGDGCLPFDPFGDDDDGMLWARYMRKYGRNVNDESVE
jgi:hypothetical protein